MQIALLADIHGNDIALEAVLENVEKNGGVDAYWILGDLVAIGHAPIRVLELLRNLPAEIIRGNTDRYVCTGDRPGPFLEQVQADSKLLPALVEVEGDFSWCQGAVTVAGWLEWLSKLPLEYRTQLPDKTDILCVHASPGTDDGNGINQNMRQHEIEDQLLDCKESLICVGHTHRPFSIEVNGKHIINPGSVSNPVGEDVRASYAIIDANENGYQVEHHRVDYDQQAVIEILEDIKHPARRFIIKHLRGEIRIDYSREP
ncbi:MAG: YfcE family phosphodiesterase [Candidatus Brocadiales bacterium]|nr:YfcE family phosphodiesterase [Candidatus Brocadiales bacterium]